MATLPLAPAACTLDEQALFTDGEFPCFQSPNRCLLLFTDGEFPRSDFAAGQGDQTRTTAAVGQGRRSYDWEDECELTVEEVAAVMLLLDDE